MYALKFLGAFRSEYIRRQLDYIVIDKLISEHTITCHVFPDLDICCDHRAVIVYIKFAEQSDFAPRHVAARVRWDRNQFVYLRAFDATLPTADSQKADVDTHVQASEHTLSHATWTGPAPSRDGRTMGGACTR